MGLREYLVKPHDFEDLMKLLQDVSARWGSQASGAV